MQAKAADYKKKIVKDMDALIKQYPIVGVVNLEGLPAKQLQAMRANLRDSVELFMTKKRLIKIALENAKGEKAGIEALEKELVGMPALLLTKESPFKLSKKLKQSQTPAPAKAGQIAPKDIVVPAGPTPFAPGPVISELSGIGLDVGVENGKVAVKVDGVVVEKGNEITRPVADVLTRLDIKPMTIGLDLVAAYEEGIIYGKDVLDVDETVYLNNLDKAALESFNLAFELGWVTKDNIQPLIGKAFSEAKSLGLEANIIDEGIVDELLAKSERSALSVKSAGNIETVDKPAAPAEEKKEEPTKEEASKQEEKPAEESKAEEPKQEEKKEEPKPEEKKETPAPEPAKEEPKAEPEQKAEEKPVEEQKQESQSSEKPEEKTPESAKEEPKEEPKPEPKAEEPKVEEKKADEKPAEPAKEEQKEASSEQSSEQALDDKEKEEMKQAEDLAKELMQKGTLRK